MKRESNFSDEFLNAFVDDQLAADEKSRVYPHISADEALSRQVCELRKLRDLVQLAYKDLVPPPVRHSASAARRRFGFGIAASLLVVASMVGGWFLHDRFPAPEYHSIDSMAQTGAWIDNDPVKIVVQVSDGSPSHTKQVLDDVEGLLQLYRSTGQAARVEVIANGDGLALLRSDVSTAPERVRQMQANYENLTFVACQNSIDRLKRDKGIVAKLRPGVAVIDSGVAQLMRRQHQGWAYIQA